MKTRLLSIFSVVILMIAFTSCKGDKKNETVAADAETVVETGAEAQKYKVDTDVSMIAWEGAKPAGKHNGTISIESGVVKVEGDQLSGSFLIDMNSITDTDLEGDMKTNLESHLKGSVEGKEDHFFNVAKYPTAAFEITGVTEKEGKKYMQGNLTIKETKKNIEFPFTYTVTGDTLTLSTEPFTIDRTIWGVNYGSKSVFDDLGDKFVNDDIQLKVDLKATHAM